MTTIDALKNLYVELGGNLENVENINVIPKMIDALSEIAGSTIELPGVTAEDNGDVLTVVDGKWAKAEAGGGSSLPDVTADDNGDVLKVINGEWTKDKFFTTYNATLDGITVTLSDNKTVADIKADVDAGKEVRIKLYDTETTYAYYYFADIYQYNTQITYNFSCFKGALIGTSWSVSASNIGLNIGNETITITNKNL